MTASAQSGTSLGPGGMKWLVIGATTILAIVIGATFANANWILIGALLLLPILALRPRELCFGMYAFLLPFDALSAVGPGGLTLTAIAGAGVAVVLFGTALLKKNLLKPPRQTWWWVFLVIWSAATVLWALELTPSLSRLLTAVSLLLVYLAVVTANISAQELRNISKFAIAGGCAASVYTAYLFFSGAMFGDEIRGSLMAGDKAADPNYLAASLLMPMSLAVQGFLTPGRWLSRLAWLAATGSIAFGIFVTMSRGALVAMVVMILFYVITGRVSRGMIVALVVLLVPMVFLLPQNFVTRMQTAVETGGAGRTTIWQGGLVAFKHYVFFGAGLNNFPYAYRKHIGGAPLAHGKYEWAAHNSYLETAVDLGLTGFVLLLVAVGAQLWAARRRRKSVSREAGGVIVGYEAACYAILVAVFFIGAIWEKWFWLAWMLLAVAVQTSQAQERTAVVPTVEKPVQLRWYDLPVRSTPRVRMP